MTIDNAPPKAGRREWIALAVLTLPTLLVTLDLNVLFLALPHLATDLQAGPIEQLWITDIYGFVIAGFLVTMGNLGDRIGRRKVLLTGAAGFIVASLVCAFATSVEMLIVGRGVLGIAGAVLMPMTVAMVIDIFKDPVQMGKALGIWASGLMAGVVLGPPLGGILLNYFWWGSVFLIAVPVMVILLLAGPLLPESRNPAGGRLDLISVGLFLVAILPVVQALKDFARTGIDVRPIVLLAVGALALTLFIKRQAKIPNPLVDLSLFKTKVVRYGLITFFFNAMLAGGIGLIAALYLQLVEGLSVLAAGLWMLPPTVAAIIISNIAPKIATQVRPGYVIGGGLAISLVGQILFTQVSAVSGLALLVVGLTVTLIGTSPVGPVGNHVVMTNIPPEQAGSVGGMVSMSGDLGAALGVAVLGSVATAVYRADVTIPAGTPAEAAGPAAQSIADASAVAGTLPPGQREGVLSAAGDAFTSGLNVVGIVAAVGFAALAVLAWRGMREVAPTGAAAHAAEEPPADEPEDGADATDRTEAA